MTASEPTRRTARKRRWRRTRRTVWPNNASRNPGSLSSARMSFSRRCLSRSLFMFQLVKQRGFQFPANPDQARLHGFFGSLQLTRDLLNGRAIQILGLEQLSLVRWQEGEATFQEIEQFRVYLRLRSRDKLR